MNRPPLHPSKSTLASVYGPPRHDSVAATLMAVLFALTGGCIIAGACLVVALALIGAL